MRRKSLVTCVLLLGLLLVTSSSAYADTIAITSVSLSNLQLVTTSGTIVFSAPVGPRTSAGAAAVNGFGDEDGEQQEGPTLSQAAASVPFASGSAISDFTNLLLSANSNVTLAGCGCDGESQGIAVLRQGFMIVGGSGNVDLSVAALLQTLQNLTTDQFSLFAASEARATLQVIGVGTFSFDSNLHVGPNELTTLETQRQLSGIFTLQFNQQYNLNLFVGANSRAAQTEVPEPATVVMLISGLGFMAGYIRKRRL